ncbi:hypothetical protein J1N35_030236 [Gossypium stocksii]|uniref:Uncharacterized protein n=1 Tax=Gossypium stocksii TaxID=47602 RepID=A0A9D3V0K4_9ROSI|nr:hypothetical protein J1N35_030236 [Gossypium stocksii]
MVMYVAGFSHVRDQYEQVQVEALVIQGPQVGDSNEPQEAGVSKYTFFHHSLRSSQPAGDMLHPRVCVAMHQYCKLLNHTNGVGS